LWPINVLKLKHLSSVFKITINFAVLIFGYIEREACCHPATAALAYVVLKK